MRTLLLICVLYFLPTQAFGGMEYICHSYTLSCDGENTLDINPHLESCLSINVLDEPLGKGLYLPVNDTYDGPREHNCALGEHNIKVEMSYIKVPTDSERIYFCGGADPAYIMVGNIWVDGKKILDNLHFNAACNIDKITPGNILYSLSVKLNYKIRGNTPDIAFKVLLFRELKEKYEYFYLKTDSSYTGGSMFNGQEVLPAPLKNIHVHGHDMQYEFLDVNKEREEILKLILEK